MHSIHCLTAPPLCLRAPPPPPPALLPPSPPPQVKKDEDAVSSVKKMIAAQRGEFGEEERKGQKEISLADELEGPVK